MEFFANWISNNLGMDWQTAGFIIMNLIILESLLSVDNAAVLATMVMDLPEHQRPRALNYGIIGAYVYRAICLAFAVVLYKVLWLKAIGGIYLIWLMVGHFKKNFRYGQIVYYLVQLVSIILFIVLDPHVDMAAITVKVLLGLYALVIIYSLFTLVSRNFDNDPSNDIGVSSKMDKTANPIYAFFLKTFGMFWATVIIIQMIDLAFSLDNIFAAVAFTDNLTLICIGVLIGIIAMRFAAEGFVKLMHRFTFLDIIAFLVIGLLGFKLCFSYFCSIEALPMSVCHISESHGFDMAISLTTIGLFVLPVLSSIFLNFPKQNKSQLPPDALDIHSHHH